MAKITKTIQIFKNGEYSQEWDIIVDADNEGIHELIDIVAINLKNGAQLSEFSIKAGLDKFGTIDLILDQHDWAMEYASHVISEQEYNELNQD